MSEANKIEREEEPEKKKLIIFGYDVSKVPCFRNSWLYGITSGIGAGLITFMFTSRPKLGGHVMVGTICGVSMSYFCVCRYNYAIEKYQAGQLKGLIQQAIVLEGIEKDGKMDEINEAISEMKRKL